MITIRFPNTAAERQALGFLAGRFSFKSQATGETLVPEQAPASLALEGIPYTVEGPATYEQLTATVRDPSSATIQ